MTSFRLKLIALILMVIDHLGYFWYDFFPIWFRWLGRASAPIFFFCMVHSFDKTSSQRRFLLRLYLFGLGMAAVSTLLMCLGYVCIGDGVASLDVRSFCIFNTLFVIAFIIRILNIKNVGKKTVLLICFLLWQVVWSIFLTYAAAYPIPGLEWTQSGILTLFVPLLACATGNVLWAEGSIIYVLFGVLLYRAKESRRKLILVFAGFSLFYFICSLTDWSMYAEAAVANTVRLLTGSELWMELTYNALYTAQLIFTGQGIESLFFRDFNWMMIGALPLVLAYNGQRGRPVKYGFYWFYPLHIYLLWLLRLLTEYG